MSNQLLGKLKIINDSRLRLQEILNSKGIESNSNSLPGLIEDVNRLKLEGTIDPPTWTGIEDIEEPTDYYKPGIDFESIYANDTTKNSYTSVAMFLMKVSNFDAPTVPQAAINGFKYFKFSDSNTLQSAVSTSNNPAHTWDKTKDIEGADGEKYRYVLAYKNDYANWNIDYNADLLALDGLIIFKGEYNALGWRDNTDAPAYTEIKSGCTFTQALLGGTYDYTCPSARTFISYADTLAANEATFFQCDNLTFVKIMGNNPNIGNYHNTFRYCTKLRYIRLGTTVGLNGENTFANLHNCFIKIDKINGDLGYTAFHDDRGLFQRATNLKIKIGEVNNVNVRLGANDVTKRPEGIELEIDIVNGNIQANALREAYIGFIGVRIHEIRGSIGEYAFYETPIYPVVKFTAGTVNNPTISQYAFAGTPIETLDMRNSLIVSISNNAFENCEQLSEIKFGNYITTLGDNLFYNCPSLKALVLSDSISTLSSYSFAGSSLENVYLGASIITLPSYCFCACRKLKTIILNEELTALGSYCFAETNALEKIILPAKISIIPTYCFYNSSIKEITFRGNIEKIDNSCFGACTNLKSIDLTGVKVFGTSCFAKAGLEKIEIPASLSSWTASSFTDIHTKVLFNEELQLTNDLNVSYNDLSIENFLKLLQSIAIQNAHHTITVSPTSFNSIRTDQTNNFYNLVKNKYITETEEGELELAEQYDEGAKTILAYITSKNISLV